MLAKLLAKEKAAVGEEQDAAALELQARWARLRSHKRIMSRVKLVVEWEQDQGPRQANAVTIDVSYSGCMAVVGGELPLRQKVKLVNAESGRKVEAQVVWRSHAAWDAGFELTRPDPSFWGL